ncbi:MAG TPA: hypothetical protein VK195_07110, partial [Burkholderiaceae bacterium]|nr:hypothetical protein [Burkholderiaceae bacterium]
MSKQPLTITQLVPNSDPPTPDTGKRFKVQINPAEFSHSREIRYNTRRTQGQNRNPTRFATVEPDTISFSLLLDGTGAAGG